MFVKHDPVNGPLLLAREATILTRLASLAGFNFVVPGLLAFEAQEAMLITAGLAGYVTLDRYYRATRLSDVSATLLAALALASLHRHVPATKGAEEQVPFPLTAPAPIKPAELVQLPADYPFLAAAVYKLRHRIEGLSAGWHYSRFIHSDFSTSNLLLRMHRRRADGPDVAIVDWEFAGVGDPLWDVGSYVGSVIHAWIVSLADGGGLRSEPMMGPGGDSLRRHIGYFLITYRHAAPEIPEAAQCFVTKVLEYAGVFLLHRVGVLLETTGFLNAAGLMMLNLACNFLQCPDRAAETLFISSLA